MPDDRDPADVQLSDVARGILLCWNGRAEARLALLKDVTHPIAGGRSGRDVSLFSAIGELLDAHLLERERHELWLTTSGRAVLARLASQP